MTRNPDDKPGNNSDDKTVEYLLQMITTKSQMTAQMKRWMATPNDKPGVNVDDHFNG
jgi:hypothetical protein